MGKTLVTVDCNGNNRCKLRLAMWKFGLLWNGKEYEGYVRDKKLDSLKQKCRQLHVKVVFDKTFSMRSTNYRKDYFASHPPHIKDRYICAYCGRLVKKKNVTIDHLYPVGKVKESIKLQKKLKRHGIHNVNDVANLVPACRRCNQRKSAKMGLWIIRGKIGRYPLIWCLRYAIRLCLIITLILAIKNMYGEDIATYIMRMKRTGQIFFQY